MSFVQAVGLGQIALVFGREVRGEALNYKRFDLNSGDLVGSVGPKSG